jgi:hypothetical protein
MGRSVEITYYGMLAERLNIESEVVELPEGDLDLHQFLTQKHPALHDFTYTTAVDLDYKKQLTKNDTPKTIAVMPPFAGG